MNDEELAMVEVLGEVDHRVSKADAVREAVRLMYDTRVASGHVTAEQKRRVRDGVVVGRESAKAEPLPKTNRSRKPQTA